MANAAIQPQNLQNLGHDWVSLMNRGQGDYGTNYLMRQFVAYRGYLGLTQSEGLYPSYSSSNGGQTLNMGPKGRISSSSPASRRWRSTASGA
jgi:hypothetical protein